MGSSISYDVEHIKRDKIYLVVRTKTRGFDDIVEKKLYNLRKSQFVWKNLTLEIQTWKFEKDSKMLEKTDIYSFKNCKAMDALAKKISGVCKAALAEYKINQ